MRTPIPYMLLLVVLAVLLLTITWEFLLEDLVFSILGIEHEVESSGERLEHIITTIVFVLLALIIPARIMTRNLLRQRKTEIELRRSTFHLDKRVKELTSLSSIGTATENESSIEDLFVKVTEIIRDAMQFPDKAWARISFDEVKYSSSTENIDKNYIIAIDIGVFGKIRGCIELGYGEDIGILDEEVSLIHDVAKRLSMTLERHELREREVRKDKLDTIQKLAGAVAHEFNQPLQAMLMASNILEKHGWQNNKDLLKEIPKQIQRISELVEKMQNITSVKTKSYAASEQIIDLDKSSALESPTESRVLIVDDEESIAELLKRIIQREGLEVDCVLSGEEGLKAIKENKYGLVISDISLPGMSGIDLFEIVSGENGTPAFVFMSGYSVEEIDKPAIKKSAGFLTKPFSVDQVSDIIKRIIRT